MLYQVILVACLDQMIWVRISVCCAFGLALGGGPGGARVVTTYAGMVPEYAGSFGYDGAPWCDLGRPRGGDRGAGRSLAPLWFPNLN